VWDRRRPRIAVVIALLGLVVLGAGLRAAEAAAPRLAQESVDERVYGALARSLVIDHDYGGPASGLRHPHLAAPAAPALFAVAYWLTPAPPARRSNIAAAYWLLALVGALVIVVTFLVGWAVGSVTAGTVAAAVVAAYPPLVRSTGELLSEPLGALLVTAGIAAVLYAQRRGRLRWLTVGGALLACAVLTRPDLFPVPFVAAALLFWCPGRHYRPSVQAPLIVVGAALLVLVPWSAFASARAGDVVLVTESDAPTLFIGTYLPGGGTLYGLKEALGEETRRRVPRLAGKGDHELSGVAVLGTVRARHPGLTARRAFLVEAGSNVRRYGLLEPGPFAGMLAGKVGRMWLTPNGARSPAMRAIHLALIALAFAGLLLGILVARSRALVLIAAVLVSATFVHVALVAHARHNLPLMPLLVAGGCAGYALAFDRRRQPQRNAVNASSPVLEPLVGPM
jgi:4-amino-4-deoxy-L-arabinose transferase-like glycosyltransferase